MIQRIRPILVDLILLVTMRQLNVHGLVWAIGERRRKLRMIAKLLLVLRQTGSTRTEILPRTSNLDTALERGVLPKKLAARAPHVSVGRVSNINISQVQTLGMQPREETVTINKVYPQQVVPANMETRALLIRIPLLKTVKNAGVRVK